MEARTVKQRIEDWKEHPTALVSESTVAVIVGDVAAKLGEDVPSNVMEALRALSLRGSMRDIASDVQNAEDCAPRPEAPSFRHFVDPVAATCRISWGEALAVIAKYFAERASKLE